MSWATGVSCRITLPVLESTTATCSPASSATNVAGSLPATGGAVAAGTVAGLLPTWTSVDDEPERSGPVAATPATAATTPTLSVPASARRRWRRRVPRRLAATSPSPGGSIGRNSRQS